MKCLLPVVIITQAIGGWFLGCIGLFGIIEGSCQAGFICTVVDGAAGLVSASSMWLLTGVALPWILIVSTMVLVVLIGLITGAARTHKDLLQKH